MLPGVTFIVWGAWWAYSCITFYLWRSARRPYRGRAWYPCGLFAGWLWFLEPGEVVVRGGEVKDSGWRDCGWVKSRQARAGEHRPPAFGVRCSAQGRGAGGGSHNGAAGGSRSNGIQVRPSPPRPSLQLGGDQLAGQLAAGSRLAEKPRRRFLPPVPISTAWCRYLYCPEGTKYAGRFALSHLNNWQHAASYPAIVMSGLVDMAARFVPLPAGTCQVGLPALGQDASHWLKVLAAVGGPQASGLVRPSRSQPGAASLGLCCRPLRQRPDSMLPALAPQHRLCWALHLA